MSDHENRRTLGVIVECAKLTPEIFAKAVEDMLKNITDKKPQGKTSLNKLMKTGKVDSIEVSDSNIGSFTQIAKKYDLTYALKRVQDENGGKQYLVCFNGKDLDTMQKAFKEYSYKQTHKKETLFSRKKIAEIQVSVPEHENERNRSKQKEHKKERSDRNISL
ncbi:MAG: PcfB family protein [Ruminococcus flavefaciens]|nr:PcfB family protein [Ruminococcus flavefaciens]MCM1059251.1 PcfB family protein [Eubacterium sp.]